MPVSPQVKKALEDVLCIMHGKGFVHGDLRPQNILVVNDTIRILDFDWAGREGVVRYPNELNISCNWHADVECGGLIAKEHDKYRIENICCQ